MSRFRSALLAAALPVALRAALSSALAVLATLAALAALAAVPARAQASSSDGAAGEIRALLENERWDEVVPALELAVADAPAAPVSQWLSVPEALFESGRMAEALAAGKVLERKWPRDPGVLGVVGAALAVLERDEEALIYLRVAAEARPDDPVSRWNLARLLAYMGRNDEAAREFATWSTLETDPQRLTTQSCVYASFVERQLLDRARACRLQQEFCPETDRTACVAAPDAARAAAGEAAARGSAP